MKREYIIKELQNKYTIELNLNGYSKMGNVIRYINQIEADKMEAYKAIESFNTTNAEYSNGRKYSMCKHCYEEITRVKDHLKDCIVNKADKYIKENS